MKKLRGSATVIIVAVAVVVTAVVVGVIVYLWQQNKALRNQTETSATISVTSVAKTQTPPATTPATTRDMTVEGNSPTDVAEDFMMYTLGTLPGAKIDYTKAKQLASKNLLSQWTDDSFVPQFYQIQDGPTTYEMATQTINGDTATVKVEVRWGEMGLAWAFSLVRENGEWKVDSIRNDAQ